MRTFLAIAFFCFASVCIGQQTNRLPLNRAFLQTNLDGNGKAATNFGTLRATNFVDAATGIPLSSGSSSGKLDATNGTGAALTLYDRNISGTNAFSFYGSGTLADGVSYYARTAGSVRIFTNANASGYGFSYDANEGTLTRYIMLSNTNGTPDTWDANEVFLSEASSSDWIDSAAAPLSPQPWHSAFGVFLPSVTGQTFSGNGFGFTNLNISGSGGMLANGQAGTLSNRFIKVRGGTVGAGWTLNNTNWIYQGEVSGSRVTITNGDFFAYSTNGAFANVRVLDQILFNDVAVQCLVHQVISANKVECWQLNVPDESTASAGVTNSANWYLIPYMWKATDFTVGSENRPTVFDSNGSLRLTAIGNQGVVGFHHHNNGTATQIGMGNATLAGLQMGPNGMYFSINSVGSNFVNAAQFVIPAETLRESQVFSTNGAVTFQYGLTNIKGGNIVARSTLEGNGSSLSNVTALHLSTTDSNAIVAAGRQATNNSGATVNLNALTATTAVNASGTGTAMQTNETRAVTTGKISVNGAYIVLDTSGAGTFANGQASIDSAGNISAASFSGNISGGSVTTGAQVISGNGSGITNLNASQLTSGTAADARLSANVALLNAAQTFSANNTFSTPTTNSSSGSGFTARRFTPMTNGVGGPTVVTNGTALGGSGASAVLDANASDHAMSVLCTVGSGGATASDTPIFTVTFANAYPQTPHVVVGLGTNVPSSGIARPPTVYSKSPSSFAVSFVNSFSPTAGSKFTIECLVIP